MYFDFVAIGSGVAGISSIENIIFYLVKNKSRFNRNISLALIDKEPKNIPGGVGYSFNTSKFGFFNNPLRLSPLEFIKFVKENNEFKKEIIDYLKDNFGETNNKWLINYSKVLLGKSENKLNELYLPRASLAIWFVKKIIKINKIVNKFNSSSDFRINLFYFKAEVSNIKLSNNNIYEIQSLNNKFKLLEPIIVKNKHTSLEFNKTNIFCKHIQMKYSIISLGLPPPKNFSSTKKINNNYIWDFYSEGSTNHLILKIIKKLQKFKNKKISVIFIGYKAGLLESLPELNDLMNSNSGRIKLICISPTLLSLEKANLTSVIKKPRFYFINNKNINNILKAKEIFNYINKEFEASIKNKFNHYDVWTKILKYNYLDKMVKKLSLFEIKKYKKYYLPKIRSMTRFTNPLLVNIKEEMEKNNKLICIKDKVICIQKKSNYINVVTKNSKYKSDIVVNVSGPLNITKINYEIPLIKSLKKIGMQFDKTGIKVSNYFELKKNKNIYMPGVLIDGFNIERKVILKKILDNSKEISKQISNKILYKNYLINNYLKSILKNNISYKKNKKNLLIRKGGIEASKAIHSIIVNNKNINEYCYLLQKFPVKLKIVIDGKAGAGKSTIGARIANIFNIPLIDSGYIFKVVALKMLKSEIILNKKNIFKITDMIKKIKINDLYNKGLNNKKIIYQTSIISNNKLIRKNINYVIRNILSNFDSFIVTGRDTGQKVFNNKKDVLKVFLNVNDIIAAKRKGNLNKIDYTLTLKRNTEDKNNIIQSKKSLIIDNNNLTVFKAVKIIIDNVVNNFLFSHKAQ